MTDSVDLPFQFDRETGLIFDRENRLILVDFEHAPTRGNSVNGDGDDDDELQWLLNHQHGIDFEHALTHGNYVYGNDDNDNDNELLCDNSDDDSELQYMMEEYKAMARKEFMALSDKRSRP